MARIAIENIREIHLTPLPRERDLHTIGIHAIHPTVRRAYREAEYHHRPKSAAEASARGEKHWNGLNSSFSRIHVQDTDNGAIVRATIVPTRYLFGQAMRDIAAGYTPEQIQELSPDMANVSLILPVQHNGEYFLLGQIKGKALGEGQIHAAVTAGNVASRYLDQPMPLLAALNSECAEELGIDLTQLHPGSFVYMVDERETGQVNFAATAPIQDLDSVLHIYDTVARSRLAQSESPEVKGLAELPVAGLALVPAERLARDVRCFYPSPEGLVERIEDREVRPYTEAVAAYASQPENRRFLLEKVA